MNDEPDDWRIGVVWFNICRYDALFQPFERFINNKQLIIHRDLSLFSLLDELSYRYENVGVVFVIEGSCSVEND